RVVVPDAGGADRLNGNHSADDGVLGEIDDPHRTLAELAQDLVAPELGQPGSCHPFVCHWDEKAPCPQDAAVPTTPAEREPVNSNRVPENGVRQSSEHQRRWPGREDGDPASAGARAVLRRPTGRCKNLRIPRCTGPPRPG